jgi:hypothetical protein
VYDVVAAVEHYSKFVPWCQRSTVLVRRPPSYLEAELEVGFQMFVERWVAGAYMGGALGCLRLRQCCYHELAACMREAGLKWLPVTSKACCGHSRHCVCLYVPPRWPPPLSPQVHLQGHAAVPHGGPLAGGGLHTLLLPHQQVGVQVGQGLQSAGLPLLGVCKLPA